VVRSIAERLDRRPELRPRGLARLLEVPRLSLVAPALGTQRLRPRERRLRGRGSALVVEHRAELEVRRGERVVRIRTGKPPPHLPGRPGPPAGSADRHPVTPETEAWGP